MKIESNKYFGIGLSGAKSDRTYIARIDEYTSENKVVLSSLKEAPTGDKKISADTLLVREIQKTKNLHTIGVDTPLQLPICLRCKLKCPGYEKCKVPAIRFISKVSQQSSKKKKRLFVPYAERAVEHYINSLDSNLFLPGALGANSAPLTARALFLQKHFKSKLKEVYPQLSYVRLSKQFKMPKKYVYAKRLSTEGDEARMHFLNHLSEEESIFMYYHDVQVMVDNPYAFEAFIVALTAYLYKVKMTEPRPKTLPKSESWLLIPKSHVEFR